MDIKEAKEDLQRIVDFPGDYQELGSTESIKIALSQLNKLKQIKEKLKQDIEEQSNLYNSERQKETDFITWDYAQELLNILGQ